MTGNRIACPPVGNPQGILTTQGSTGLEISGNYVQGCTLQNAIVSDLYSGRIQSNIINPRDITYADYTVIAATDPLLIPDGVADTVALQGINSFSHILRLSQAAVGTGIGGVRVDIAGSGFINNDIATITGCSTDPTGVRVAADRAGHLTGLRLGTRGWGCARPTVTFNHGTGESITFMVGAWQNTLNDISLLVLPGGSLTISGGGNVFLHGDVWRVGVNSLLRFKQIAGQFVEESRNF
jgi:hypothetical protein